ncbi:MAG: hypothetical protein QNL17_01010 [Synechococcus sp. ChSW.bin.154]
MGLHLGRPAASLRAAFLDFTLARPRRWHARRRGRSRGWSNSRSSIEGIIYLTKSTDEFREMYLDQQKEWF